MNKTRKGLYVAPDDLRVGRYFAVVGKKNRRVSLPIDGMAFKVTAIQLPFVIGQLVIDSEHPPLTMDIRRLNFMRVGSAYVKAQTIAPKAAFAFFPAPVG